MWTRLLTLSIWMGGCFYISADEHARRWDVDQDGVERPEDCDDKDPSVQDRVWYTDFDEDGYGDPASSVVQCEGPPGMVDNGDDCDDQLGSVHPGALETCNEIDDDCNEVVDDGDAAPLTWYVDADLDGFGVLGEEVSACEAPPGTSDQAGDCDDGDADIHPDAADVCNGVNDDCAGVADDDPAYWVDWYPDLDGDGFGDETSPPTVTSCAGGVDEVSNADDCDDDDGQVSPLAVEVCDGADNDCDGATDPPTSADATEWWLDADGDGFGWVSDVVSLCTCEPILGCYRVDNPLDCDDGDGDIHPQAEEVCGNNADDNCNTQTDELPCLSCDTGDTGC